MAHRDIALATLEHRPTPRSSAALLSAGCWTINRQGYTLQDLFGRPELLADLVVGTHAFAPSDIVWVGSGYHNLAIGALGGKLKFRARGAPDVVGPPPPNPLAFKPDSQIDTLVKATALVSKAIGKWVLVGSSQWGPFTLTGHLLGVERLMRAMVKEPEALRPPLDFATELCVDYLKLFVAAGAEVVSIAEPSASGDLISREHFEAFALPPLKRAVAALKAAGAKVVVHICGNVTTRLDLLAASGADLVSVDYKVDLAAARKALSVFAGNLNPVAVMQNATPDQVRAAAAEALRQAGPEPGYMLMPGCDIPPSVPLVNVRALLGAVITSNKGETRP